MNIIKVRYYSDTTKEYSNREYSYFSEEPLSVGDIVTVPVRNTTGKAMVSVVDVPESEIIAFKDAVKTIPAGTKKLNPKEQVMKDEIENMELPEPPESVEPEITFKLDSPSSGYTTAVIILRPDLDPGYDILKSSITGLKEYADKRIVTSDADLKFLTDDMILIGEVKKSLTELKDKYVKPIQNHLDEVRKPINELFDLLAQADLINQQKWKTFTDAQKKKAAEIAEVNRQASELARRQAELSGTGEFTADTTVIEAPAPVQKVSTNTGTVSTRKVWKARVIDFAKLDDIYKLANQRMLDAVAATSRQPIAGVEYYIDESLTRRGK